MSEQQTGTQRMSIELKVADKKKERYPWIVSCDGRNPNRPWGFACLRCGTVERLPHSLPIDAYLAWAKSFMRLHKNCKEKTDAQLQKGA